MLLIPFLLEVLAIYKVEQQFPINNLSHFCIYFENILFNFVE